MITRDLIIRKHSLVGIFFYSAGICGITVLITKRQGHIAGVVSVAVMLISTILFVWWIPSGGMSGATWGLMWAYGLFGALISLCVCIIPLKPTHTVANMAENR